MRCFCSICRKCNGSSGYGINIMAETNTLKVEGMENVKSYQAIMDHTVPKEEQKISSSKRHFCGICGSHLWLHEPKEWPQWVYPYASCIDTPLPKPPHSVNIMLGSKPAWVDAPDVSNNVTDFEGYPNKSLETWHRENKFWVE